jgi:hypothetical protein
MGCLRLPRLLTGEKTELPKNNIGSGKALPVVFLKIFGAYGSTFIDQVSSGKRHSIPTVISRKILVQDSEGSNCPGIGIRNERIGDPHPLGKIPE